MVIGYLDQIFQLLTLM